MGPVLALLLAAAGPSPAASPSPAAAPPPASEGPVILFLVDNSASLPPLDPDEKRVAALEKMFTFLQGRPYRLVLFGGRKEVFVDDVTRYRNNGQWTDYYAAFEKASELMKEYPKGTEFRIILVTDAIPDPNPADWSDAVPPGDVVNPGADVKDYVSARTVALLRRMGVPLYVILVGETPPGGEPTVLDPERSPGLIFDMVRAANGMQAAPWAQSLSGFFGDDGVLLKKFIYRVAPAEGLKKVEPVVRRIVAPPRRAVELQFGLALLLPVALFALLFVGILVRSYPGAGDTEVVELKLGQPVHVAADRPHKLETGGWATSGLGLVAEARDADATFTYQAALMDLTGTGLSTADPDPLTVQLLPLGLDELRSTLERFSTQGSKDEKIYALNMEYIARSFDPKEAERLLTTAPADRHRISALDFLRAKVYLLSDAELRKALTAPHVHVIRYGKDAGRKELEPGAHLRIGPYGYVVAEIARGGRKDARLVLQYERIRSFLGIKSWMPSPVQRLCRFRRSSERVVC
jgi:hypothetical protein